jgi:ATP-dependent RNA helicase RhlE
MGFIHDIKRILAIVPEKRQTLMFSATFSPAIRTLAKSLLKAPVEITVTPPNSTVDRIEQALYCVNYADKRKLLVHLIKTYGYHHVLVFSRTKHGANRLATALNKADIPAAAIHGNKSQNVRTRALSDFKNNDIQVLVATDIAARGIDIAQLPYVINYDLPDVAEDYVHRIGRTGRAGETGMAISFASIEQAKALNDIERLIQLHIPRKTEDGFSCAETIPTTDLTRKAKKPKKPKQPKAPSGTGDKSGSTSPSTKRRRRRRPARRPSNS